MDDASRGRAAGKEDGPADIAAGEGAPCLDLDGFSGPLDLLLALARAQRIDLKRIPLPALLDQLYPSGGHRLADVNLVGDLSGACTSAVKIGGRYLDGDHHWG